MKNNVIIPTVTVKNPTAIEKNLATLEKHLLDKMGNPTGTKQTSTEILNGLLGIETKTPTAEKQTPTDLADSLLGIVRTSTGNHRSSTVKSPRTGSSKQMLEEGAATSMTEIKKLSDDDYLTQLQRIKLCRVFLQLSWVRVRVELSNGGVKATATGNGAILVEQKFDPKQTIGEVLEMQATALENVVAARSLGWAYVKDSVDNYYLLVRTQKRSTLIKSL